MANFKKRIQLPSIPNNITRPSPHKANNLQPVYTFTPLHFYTLLFLLLPFLSPAQTTPNPELALFEKRLFQSSDGQLLPYRILLPEGYSRGKRYPLLLFLHGAGERGRDNEAQLAHGASLFLDKKNRRDFPAIVVFPQCAPDEFWTPITREGKSWNFPFTATPQPSLQRVIELLEELEKKEAIDKQQIYLMGLSMGGFAVFDLLARFPKRFAAAVPIAGGGNPLLAPLYSSAANLWIFHGAKDDVVPVALSRQMNEALVKLDANVRYTEYPEAKHESWNNAFAEEGLLKWIFSNRLFAKGRYKRALFSKVQKDTYPYSNKNGAALELDVYRPQGDAAKNRAALLYVHGGGFAGGRRDEPFHVQFSEKLARMGFVVVSMSYRLTMKGQSFSCDQPTANKIKTFQAAVQDIREATNYLLDHQEKLGIDPGKLVLAGSSAGAEAILHAAYWQDKDLPPDSPRLPGKFRYGGLISLAGAIVDTNLITAKRAVPSLFFHGTCDPLVPYGAAPHHFCQETDPGYLPLFGPSAIVERLRNLGMPFFLATACNGQHEWNSLPMSDFIDEILNFLNEDVINGRFRQLHLRYTQEGKCEKGFDVLECETIKP
ncbi:MAG: alpha/beta hydrolase fold domain-containing protein [Lewinellaceae bacterium]|nr:alpha/beta hydrolase fold domain-containing protein [Phaeodactylibacter sp.]MCB9039370.1 alpha/beta hydrolase fold domain-containing protein [Lewinellaceae bacterium]